MVENNGKSKVIHIHKSREVSFVFKIHFQRTHIQEMQ